MNKLDRYQQLHRIFSQHRTPVSKKVLAEKLECTEKSISRYIDDLRYLFQAPIVYNSEKRGWGYDRQQNSTFELPGLWLTASDIQSLLLLIEMLQQYGQGLLGQELQGVNRHIERILEKRGIDSSALQSKVRIIPLGNRIIPDNKLYNTFEALTYNKRLCMHYQDYSGQKTEREISPQRLVYYRDNWYLDAWCHLRSSLRSFSLARVQYIEAVNKSAQQVADEILDNHFSQGYGLFAGVAKHTAKLRFFPAIAKEIAQQQWHPEQKGEWEGKDYLLTLPYSDDRELIQDILRHCPNVYVESPAKLRKRVQTKLQDALGVFTGQRIFI